MRGEGLLEPGLRRVLAGVRLGVSPRGGGRPAPDRRGGGTGLGTEFAEHRRYTVGDELRYLDWNVLGRLGEAYVKRFEREEAGRLTLLLDGTASMAGPAWPTARKAAAVVGYVGLRAGYRVEVTLVPPGTPAVRAFHGRGAAGALEDWLVGLRAGRPAALGPSLAAACRRRAPGTVAVWITDLADPRPEPLLRRLRGSTHALLLVQILHPLPRGGEAETLRDPETGAELTVPRSAWARYRRAAGDFLAAVAETARRLAVRLARVEAGTTDGAVLTRRLREGGVLR